MTTKLLTLLASCALAVSTASQVPYHHQKWLTTHAVPGGDYFGHGVLAADFDQDGFDDVLCPEPSLLPSVLWLFYGPSFTRYRAIRASDPLPHEGLGFARGSLGDVNGDGSLDILMPAIFWPSGPPSASIKNIGRVRVFYGPDFTTNHGFDDPTPQHHGYFGAGNLLYDVDGDGRDDVFIGAPSGGLGDGDPSPGEVWYWNATDLSSPTHLPSPFNEQPGIAYGYFIRAGDVDNDGLDELLVSALQYSAVGKTGAVGIIQLPRFEPGSFLTSFGPPFVIQNLGYLPLDPLVDLTGDGILDLVVGAENSASFPLGSNLPGVVVVLEGPEFNSWAHYLQPPEVVETDHFGAESLVYDLDNDGHLDIAVGDPDGGNGSGIRIWYGPAFDTVHSVTSAFGGSSGLGRWMAHGDFDADGYEDLAAFDYGSIVSGRVGIFEARTLTANSQLASVALGGPIQLDFDAGPAHAGRSYIAALGHTGTEPGIVYKQPLPFHAPLNIDSLTALGVAALGSPVFQGFTGTLDAAGHAHMTFYMPSNMPLVQPGETLVIAAAVLNAEGKPIMGSSPVEILLGP